MLDFLFVLGLIFFLTLAIAWLGRGGGGGFDPPFQGGKPL